MHTSDHLRGWQQQHLPTPPAPPKPPRRRSPRMLAVLVLLAGGGTAGWYWRGDLLAIVDGTRQGAANAKLTAQQEAARHEDARAGAMEHLFDVTADPNYHDAGVIGPENRTEPSAAPTTLVPVAPPPAEIKTATAAAPAPASAPAARPTEQQAAARRGLSIADNEIAKAQQTIATNKAAIAAAHKPGTGAWDRLKAAAAAAQTPQQQADVHVAWNNLAAQEQNANQAIADAQHSLDTWTARRKQLAAQAASAAPPTTAPAAHAQLDLFQQAPASR